MAILPSSNTLLTAATRLVLVSFWTGSQEASVKMLMVCEFDGTKLFEGKELTGELLSLILLVVRLEASCFQPTYVAR